VAGKFFQRNFVQRPIRVKFQLKFSVSCVLRSFDETIKIGPGKFSKISRNVLNFQKLKISSTQDLYSILFLLFRASVPSSLNARSLSLDQQSTSRYLPTLDCGHSVDSFKRHPRKPFYSTPPSVSVSKDAVGAIEMLFSAFFV